MDIKPIVTTASAPERAGAAATFTAPRATVAERLRDVWVHRGLFVHFASRALEKNYTRTKLGWGWLVIRPVMDILAKTIVFGGVLKVPSAGVPYLLFYLVGSSAWRVFDRGVYWGTRGIELNRKLIERLYFPRLLLPAAALIPALFEFGVYVVLTLAAVGYYWVAKGHLYLSGGLPLLVGFAGLFLLVLFAGSITLWTSVWGREYRDVRFTMRYVLEFWFFVTPILYPLSAVPSDVRFLAIANPVTSLVEMMKWGFVDAGDVHALWVLWSIGCICVSIGCGLWYFRRYELSFTRESAVEDDDDWDD